MGTLSTTTTVVAQIKENSFIVWGYTLRPVHFRNTMKYRRMRARVIRKIWEDTLREIQVFVKDAGPQLWGLQRRRGFLPKMVVVAPYKDLYGLGYHKLYRNLKRWLPLADQPQRVGATPHLLPMGKVSH